MWKTVQPEGVNSKNVCEPRLVRVRPLLSHQVVVRANIGKTEADACGRTFHVDSDYITKKIKLCYSMQHARERIVR